MDYRSETVLVVGGCGFLGSHIVDAFVRDNWTRVVAISRNPTKYCNPAAEYVACDATNHHELAAAIGNIRPGVIVHTMTPGPFAPLSQHDQEHVTTKNMVRFALKDKVKAFIYTGSAETIANVSGSHRKPLSESEAILYTAKTAPSAYAWSKSTSDSLVLEANGRGLRTAVLRLPAIYGPRDGAVAAGLLEMGKTFISRIQWGRNEVLHDWIYVESAAYAYVQVAKALLGPQRDIQHRVDGEAFFITDGIPMKFWDFTRSLWVAAGNYECMDMRVIVLPWWVITTLAVACEVVYFIFTFGPKIPPLTRQHLHYMKEGSWFDIEKARKRFGYQPLLRTEEGIRETVAWFRQH